MFQSNQTVVNSACAFEFPLQRDLIFGLLEASYGVGFTLGPLVGQVLYAEYGFKTCFMLVSAILLLPMTLIPFMQFSKEEYSNLSRDKSLHEDVTYRRLLMNKRTFVMLSALYACIVCMIFYEPLLTNQLTSMSIQVNKIGKYPPPAYPFMINRLLLPLWNAELCYLRTAGRCL